MGNASADGAGDARVIETGERLSRSMLWRIHRRWFEEAGVTAWSTGAVPHHATSNPALADAYADMLLGFFRDARDAGEAPLAPLTVVELGAGSGRFAFCVLRALAERLPRSPLAGARIRYVLTDFAERNVAFAEAHASLRPFVAEGSLDFAVFDVEADRTIRLRSTGETLSLGGAGPLAVIANYVLDSLPQDVFSFAGGSLEEHLITLSARRPVSDPASAPGLSDLDIAFSRRPAPLDYYGEPALDELLSGYAARLDGATILFPTAALRCFDRLAELSDGRMLLLSADRGEAHEDALDLRGAPDIGLHGGCVSLDVNYHALAEHVRARGGLALLSPHPHEQLTAAALLLGAHPSGWIETRNAFARSLEHGGPVDFFSVRRAIRDSFTPLDLPQMLALIRLSHWDPCVLRDCLPALRRHRASATPAAAREVLRTVMRVWERYYPIGEPEDLAFAFALLAHAYGGLREALALFQASLDLHGPDPRAHWNMALCHLAGGDVDAASASLRAAAALAPGFAPAEAMLTKE